MSSPSLSIVIPTHRRPKQLLRLLRSLDRQDFPRDELEIFVVSNFAEAKPDGWERLERPLSWGAAGGLGVNRARNAGWKQCRGGVVLFLDDDVELPDRSLLRKHVDYHQSHPEISGFGGAYSLPAGANWLERAYHSHSLGWISSYYSPDGGSPYLLGGHASYKNALWSEGFSFHDQIIFGGTETDFNWRLHRAGKKLVFRPEISVTHHAALSVRSLSRKAFLQARHARIRKQASGEPAPVEPPSLAVRRFAASCSSGSIGLMTTHLAIRLYELAGSWGWASVGQEERWRFQAIGWLCGASLRAQN